MRIHFHIAAIVHGHGGCPFMCTRYALASNCKHVADISARVRS
jgi:hypothetical protein